MTTGMWFQNYSPLGSATLSTLAAALPLLVLLGLLAARRGRAPIPASLGVAAAPLVAIAGIGMPPAMAAQAALFGAADGIFPIGWVLLHLIFLYHLADH